MNVARHDRDADRQGPGERRLPHPAHHLFGRLLLRDGRLCRPDPAGHHLPRALGLHLAARPADLVSRTARPTAIRQPVLEPDRDVRPFQDVLLDLGARLGLPGMVDRDGSPAFPEGYADYLVHHERKPGIGALAGWRGADGSRHGRGAPNPDQLQRYIEHGCFWQDELPPGAALLQARQPGLSRLRGADGLHRRVPSRSRFQLYSEVLQKFRLAAQGPSARCSRHASIARASRPTSIRCRSGIRRSSHGDERRLFPMHAITQRPMAMYHSWGSHERLAAPDPRQQPPLSRPCARRASWGSRDDDWVWVTSRHGRIKAQVRLMDGVNPDTCWTWNAIGKRAGAWHLRPQRARGDARASCSTT